MFLFACCCSLKTDLALAHVVRSTCSPPCVRSNVSQCDLYRSALFPLRFVLCANEDIWLWVVRHYGQDVGCTSLWAGFGLYVIMGRIWLVRHCGQDVGCTSLWAGCGLYVIVGRIWVVRHSGQDLGCTSFWAGFFTLIEFWSLSEAKRLLRLVKSTSLVSLFHSSSRETHSNKLRSKRATFLWGTSRSPQDTRFRGYWEGGLGHIHRCPGTYCQRSLPTEEWHHGCECNLPH